MDDKIELPTKHSESETRNREKRLVERFVPDISIYYKIHKRDEFLLCVVPNSRITLSKVYTRRASDKKLPSLLFGYVS